MALGDPAFGPSYERLKAENARLREEVARLRRLLEEAKKKP